VDLTEEQFGSCSGNLADVSELDLKGIVLREAAVEDVLHAFLFHKGFRAMQAYRFAHMLWSKGRTHMAIAVKARANEVYVCDIHPSAYIGPGLSFICHHITSLHALSSC
jgi:serine O-acetyltransferase